MKTLVSKIAMLNDGREISPGEEFECSCDASADLYLERGWCEPAKKKAAKKKAKAAPEE